MALQETLTFAPHHSIHGDWLPASEADHELLSRVCASFPRMNLSMQGGSPVNWIAWRCYRLGIKLVFDPWASAFSPPSPSPEPGAGGR